MKKTKKIIGLTMAAIMLCLSLFCLTGCGKDKELTPEEQQAAAWEEIFEGTPTDEARQSIMDEVKDYIQDKYVGKKDTKLQVSSDANQKAITNSDAYSAEEFKQQVFTAIDKCYKENNAKNWNLVINAVNDNDKTLIIYFIYNERE